MHEEWLKQREAELAERELTLLQRELNIMIVQQQHQPHATTPTPKKRKGKFRKRLLKKEPSSSSSSMISAPSGKPDCMKDEGCITRCSSQALCFNCYFDILCRFSLVLLQALNHEKNAPEFYFQSIFLCSQTFFYIIFFISVFQIIYL